MPLPDGPPSGPAAPPLSLVVCVSDEAALRANLLASPDLGPGSPHELLAYRGCPDAAAGLNDGLSRARHPPVVCVHQDVYLPRGWAARLARRFREAVGRLGPIGVAGPYGVAAAGGRCRRLGRVVDRDRLLDEPGPLPAAADTLDELLLVLPRGTPLRVDPALGFHLYGADLALAARAAGRAVAVAVLDAPCLHNSRGGGLPPAFFASAAAFAAKWPDRLPVATPCALVGRDGLGPLP